MIRQLLCLGIVVLAAGTSVSCFARPGNDAVPSARAQSGITYGTPQQLPLVSATLAGRAIRVMLVKTDEQRAYGLMFRKELACDEGMLFCYDAPFPMTFWMKNTILPLDLVFFDENLRLNGIIRGMKPGIGIADALLPRYSAERPAQYALEVASGAADAWGLRPGDRLEIPLPLLATD
ncbi:MAG TPA: DUF192 domain-containing protein [Candidatus Ozemobacteraceae bacterium]|nr:DUF192 domain-containing protein [Candidatus Ozemobacteraceae bacterium]